MELSRQTAMTMEASVLNKDTSIFFSFVPRLYYVLPWKFRLIPENTQTAEEYQEEIEELDDEERRDLE